MANNNMAFILIAAGAAVIGATILLKPKEDEEVVDTGPDDDDDRKSLNDDRRTPPVGVKPNPQPKEVFTNGPGGTATGWLRKQGQEGLEGEVVWTLPPADILADDLPYLAAYNAVVAL